MSIRAFVGAEMTGDTIECDRLLFDTQAIARACGRQPGEAEARSGVPLISSSAPTCRGWIGNETTFNTQHSTLNVQLALF